MTDSTTATSGKRAFVAACLKWVDSRPTVDHLTGSVTTDRRTSGPSPADEAALEWALRIGEAWELPTVAVTAGPAVAASMLADAMAAGASRAVRVELVPDQPGAAVAAGLAEVLGDAVVVVCGAWSLDGGTGSVPAFLAAHLGAAQALGVVELDVSGGDAPALRAVRRLDGGRRERLALPTPAVLSVEADIARLRRSSLRGVLSAGAAPIEVHAPLVDRRAPPEPVTVAPFRPRTHSLAPPEGDNARQRILTLTGAAVQRSGGAKVVTLPPNEAAEAILDALREWGYLP